jgi:hypothetical protein
MRQALFACRFAFVGRRSRRAGEPPLLGTAPACDKASQMGRNRQEIGQSRGF